MDAIVQGRCQYDERRALCDMVDRANVAYPAIVIAGRGYESYNVFAHIQEKDWKFLIRVKDRNRSSNGIANRLELPAETVLTNLDFPPDDLKHLYAMRWGIEASFRELKYTIGLSHFHSKRPDFIF